MCAGDASCRALGVADNDAVSQWVKVKLGTKLCKKLNRCVICPAYMCLSCNGIEITPESDVEDVLKLALKNMAFI